MAFALFDHPESGEGREHVVRRKKKTRHKLNITELGFLHVFQVYARRTFIRDIYTGIYIFYYKV
jgi:hypothetical protein